MSSYHHLERRIDHLLERATRRVDEQLLGEMEDVLATGYAHALHGDARSLHLSRRLEALADDIGEDGVAKEVRRLTLERRAIEESTLGLRARLHAVRELVVEFGGPRRSA